MRQRVTGLLLTEERYLLLVKDCRVDFYYAPGGGIEENESHLEALQREFQEELGLRLIHADHYFSFTYRNIIMDISQEEHVYFVKCYGEPTVQVEDDEDALGFYSRNCIKEKGIILPDGFKTSVWDRLIADNYL